MVSSNIRLWELQVLEKESRETANLTVLTSPLPQRIVIVTLKMVPSVINKVGQEERLKLKINTDPQLTRRSRRL